MTLGTLGAIGLLLAVLAAAVLRPFGRPEALIAVPAAAIAVGAGLISPRGAAAELVALAPVVGFLAAVLILARLCADDGLFSWCGQWMATAAAGRPQRLLGAVFVVASTVTAVFSLDATVVLLTPVVFATTTALGIRARPHVYACSHLSNTASLLLPVSNLTNLLAFHASGLSFLRFAALMVLPWLVAIGAEYAGLRRFFAADLAAPVRPPAAAPAQPVATPRFAIAVVAATLVGFLAGEAFDIPPVWTAAAGAAVLALRAGLRRRATVRTIAAAADPLFLAFVLALAVVVRAVIDNGLGVAVARFVPHSTGVGALLGLAAVAAVLANTVNNLPAVLLLLPLAGPAGPAAVLAVLIGTNIGPNLTYAGSLATLLWRRILHLHDHPSGVAEYTLLGLLTVPAALIGAVLALWAATQLIGA